MRRLRAKFGRRSVIPAAGWICCIVAVFAALYALSVWRVSVLWPAVKPAGAMHPLTACLCIRRDGALDRVLDLADADYWPTLREESIAASDKVIVQANAAEDSVRPWHARWSATSTRTSLVLVDVSTSSAATGVRLTAAERQEVFRFVQDKHGPALPAALVGASTRSVSVPIPGGVIHEWLRQGAFLVFSIGGGLCVWLVIRGEQRYRRRLLTHCHFCGYSLAGLPGACVCPECGKAHAPDHGSSHRADP